MSFRDLIRKHARNLEYQITFRCKQGTILILFNTENSALEAALGPDHSLDLFLGRGPEVLPKVTSAVQIIVKGADKKEGQVSARFSAAECPAILEGGWPDSDTFSFVAAAVRERKYYPMPEPEILGGGGKSMTAQGQTKKEGSHSQDRHK